VVGTLVDERTDENDEVVVELWLGGIVVIANTAIMATSNMAMTKTKLLLIVTQLHRVG